MRSPTPDDFQLDPGLVYLNHGSFGGVPRVVQQEYERLQREMERNPVAWLQRDASDMLAVARGRVGQFVGAAADDIAFFPNPTTAMNMVAASLQLQPGDEVLSTDHDYGAMHRTWRKRCADSGAHCVRVPIPLPVTTPDDFIERVWAAVTPRTRVLFLDHISSATALVFPVHELCRRARAAGIVAIVDGAHVPGQLPLDLATLDCDVYTGALHKWVCAPKGCSFLYVRREQQAWLQPLVVSWGWESDQPTGSVFVDHHEWQGSRDLSPFLAAGAAIDFLAGFDWPAVQANAHRLAVQTRERIDQLTGLHPISPADDGGPAANGWQWLAQMAAVRLPAQVDVAQWKQRLLAEHRIEVPLHLWNDQPLLRVSIAPHTTQADTDALVSALEGLVGGLTSAVG